MEKTLDRVALDPVNAKCNDPETGVLLYDYVRDLLTDEAAARTFERHAGGCSYCQDELAAWTWLFDTFAPTASEDYEHADPPPRAMHAVAGAAETVECEASLAEGAIEPVDGAAGRAEREGKRSGKSKASRSMGAGGGL